MNMHQEKRYSTSKRILVICIVGCTLFIYLLGRNSNYGLQMIEMSQECSDGKRASPCKDIPNYLKGVN